MFDRLKPALLAMGLIAATPGLAETSDGFRAADGAAELQPYLQCVPYARELSGISIYGDAHSWWGQAEGRYERGHSPRVGAVMAFRPHGGMQLGHVATVSRVIDSRTVLLDHANWSPINGRRGQIERDVQAIDVSPENDWSEVRVWYAPLQALGTTRWPVHGFIYGERDKLPQSKFATAPARLPRAASPEFASAFAALDAAPPRPTRSQQATPTRVAASPASRRSDPLDAVVRRYEN